MSSVVLAAAPEFATVSEPTSLLTNGNGTWPRLFPREDGSWYLVMSNGGDLYWRTLHADLSTKDESRHNLTNHGNLTDHAVAGCPDGGLIDAASSYTSDWDDTLTVFRWDADFNLVNQYTLDKNNATHSFADAAILCEEDFAIVGGFIERDKTVLNTPAYILDPDTAEVTQTTEFFTGITWFGAAWAWNGEHVINLRASTNGNTVAVERVDPSTWAAVEGKTELIELHETHDTHWFVRTLAWEDHWIVPFIQLDPDHSWQQGGGDLYLAVFDADWSLVSTTRVTDYQGGSGAIQPWVSTDGEVIAVSWTHDVAPYGAILTLEEPEQEDTATPDSGTSDSGTPSPEDTAPTGDSGSDDTGLTTAPLQEEPEGCGGCSGVGGLSGAWCVGLLGLLWRRSRANP